MSTSLDALQMLMFQAGSRFLRSVRPVYGINPSGLPDHLGSCVLLKIGEHRLAITAAHIIDNLPKTPLAIGGSKELVQVAGTIHTSPKPGNNRDKDRHDFAVWPISERVAAELGDVAYLDSAAIAPNRHSREAGLYFVFGYPNSRNSKLDFPQKQIPAKAFSYAARSEDNPALANKLNISGNGHLFIPYEKYVMNSAGRRSSSVRPKGFSGGALIELDLSTDAARSPLGGKLAGIVIEFHQPYAMLVAVKIQVILASIFL